MRVITLLLLLSFGSVATPAMAEVKVQCPNDPSRNIKCMSLSAGDGFINMADGRLLYIFGFSDVTGVPNDDIMTAGMLNANFSAPVIALKQGQEFYLTLTNVGMKMRPDLFDPHTVHFHGYPNAISGFDGEPEATFGVTMGNSFTYYYKLNDPGTYMYHCHVEAAEHMQQGMLGNLYVLPAQDDLPDGTILGTHVHHTGDKYVYNDGDGSTQYDVEYPIQMGSFDAYFHDQELGIQHPFFAYMKDDYTMLNGRGYPDTANPADVSPSQRTSSLITAKQGQKILLRITSLSVTHFYTLALMGMQMKVVGGGARQLKSSSGQNLYYTTNSVTLGGGEGRDAIIDTTNVPKGTYELYTTNLNYLSNGAEDFGGMMTEVVIQ